MFGTSKAEATATQQDGGAGVRELKKLQYREEMLTEMKWGGRGMRATETARYLGRRLMQRSIN